MTPGGRLWVAVCALLAVGCFSALFVPAAQLDWQPALAWTEPWRWWTAAFVHWSEMHLMANLAGLGVIAALGRAAAVPALVALAWLASWPWLHLALLLRPELAHYGGLSGLLHAGVAAAALYLARVETGRRRQIALAILAGLVTKLLLEAPWGPALQHSATWDISIAPLAHLNGALLGALCTVIALARGPSATASQDPSEPAAAAMAETGTAERPTPTSAKPETP